MKLLNTINCAILAAALLATSCNTPEAPVQEEPKADFTQVIPTLQAITADWNKGDLDEFITVYDSAATFMLPKGPIGVSEMKGYYQEAFTETGTPTSTLSFDSLEMRPLGNSHALVTGRYILTSQDSTEQSGRYTLVLEHSDRGWKILHDHSN
ncbi:YybH family protein [Pontibacter mangrovi]|uniref:Nuclear transport factor 2 family protein n=1 Tax=Pontibacter mangrovi TaxID=2589816 RepID=A0A501W5V9_9BACT|nr:nuclear transport factor 2 family protein [Pontibacter mangrovi]TPE45283.1 nuclear transport factor 2 family protein [Pontibacter mangrovi]